MSDNTGQLLDAMAQAFSDINVEFSEFYSTGDAPNGKYYRTYNQREALALSGIKNNKVLNSMCDSLGFSYKNGSTWRINQLQMDILRDTIQSKKVQTKGIEYEKRKAIVTIVGILKGGPGKTTVSTLLATGMASQASRPFKCLLIDLDPQKTASILIKPNLPKKYTSIGDLMMSNQNDSDFKDEVNSGIHKTNYSNLDIICAADSDRNYDIFVKKQEIKANEKGLEYACYKDLRRVITNVENDYDLIIIDTPPHFTAANLSAHYVAENIIMPVKPSELDWDSAGVYLNFLSNTYPILEYLEHPGYKEIKLLISSQSTNSNTESRLAQKLRLAAGMNNCFLTPIPRADAILAAAEQRCTIFDISVSEFGGTKSSLRKAQESGHTLIGEFELMINEQLSQG
jgi:cellulose biosynthesis protein BcsQ